MKHNLGDRRPKMASLRRTNLLTFWDCWRDFWSNSKNPPRSWIRSTILKVMILIKQLQDQSVKEVHPTRSRLLLLFTFLVNRVVMLFWYWYELECLFPLETITMIKMNTVYRSNSLIIFRILTSVWRLWRASSSSTLFSALLMLLFIICVKSVRLGSSSGLYIDVTWWIWENLLRLK